MLGTKDMKRKEFADFWRKHQQRTPLVECIMSHGVPSPMGAQRREWERLRRGTWTVNRSYHVKVAVNDSTGRGNSRQKTEEAARAWVPQCVDVKQRGSMCERGSQSTWWVPPLGTGAWCCCYWRCTRSIRVGRGCEWVCVWKGQPWSSTEKALAWDRVVPGRSSKRLLSSCQNSECTKAWIQ